jgi:hypothetical protein
MGKTRPMPVVWLERLKAGFGEMTRGRGGPLCRVTTPQLGTERLRVRFMSAWRDGPLTAWLFNRAFVSMSYLPIAMF